MELRQHKKENFLEQVAFSAGNKQERQRNLRKSQKSVASPKKATKKTAAPVLVWQPSYTYNSQQLLLTIFFQNLLNSFGWIQQVCDGSIVVQCVDEQSDVFAHVYVDVVFF